MKTYRSLMVLAKTLLEHIELPSFRSSLSHRPLIDYLFSKALLYQSYARVDPCR